MTHLPLLAQAAAAKAPSTTPLVVIGIYIGVLLAITLFSSRLFRGTSADYFVASRSIGPFMLLMSVFGTTMTAFALVGSTGEAFQRGIGVYGLMASSSGLIHAACFFLIGIKLWAFGKKYGYVTQIQFFRARFESPRFGYLLFPILVLLVIPYLLIGVLGTGKTMAGVTKGMFPELFASTGGSVPPWLSGLAVCLIVLVYVFFGGSRTTAWANTFQTIVFMCMGLLAFYLISNKLGGLSAAIEAASPKHLVRTPGELAIAGQEAPRHTGIPPLVFLTYMFIPLSVGMFPHLFQHWLTARSAKSFRLTVIAHPLCIMIVWVPCVLIGTWATAAFVGGIAGMPAPLNKAIAGLPDQNTGAVLSLMVKGLIKDPVVVGLVTAGVLAAIMSSLDSQFLCLGTMFTNDIVLHGKPEGTYTDKQIVRIARLFIVGIVAITYLVSLAGGNVFDLAVWSFSGFASLTPLVFAALYWKGATRAGAYAAVIASIGTWLFYFVKSGFGGEILAFGAIVPAAACFGAGAIAMIVVSLVTPKPSGATIDKFFPDFR